MPLRISNARSKKERKAVFELRYDVYVIELARSQRYADHAHRAIEEPLDERGRLHYACEHNLLVGTVRSNYARDGSLGEYETLYGLHRLGHAERRATSITTKLVVAPSHRNTPIAYRLAAAVYRDGLQHGILFDLIDVYPERVPFFQRLGYRVCIPQARHPEYGQVVVMQLCARDAAHLARVGSPFLRLLKLAGDSGLQPGGEVHGSVS